MSETEAKAIEKKVRSEFERNDVSCSDIDVREFPGETIVIVSVPEPDFQGAVDLASKLDDLISGGFITVRKAPALSLKTEKNRITSLQDTRVSKLIELLNSRSRTSEQQPSLRYVKDAAEHLNVAVSRRHHIIFGRRGVGKTALMLEAKKVAEKGGALTFWINVQTLRHLNAAKAFLSTMNRLCDLPQTVHAQRSRPPASVDRAKALQSNIEKLLEAKSVDMQRIALLIPQIQQMIDLLTTEVQSDLYLFFDDIHYLATDDQPYFLDMLHSITRDTRAWIKVAGIKHQSRWFIDTPPTGLQTTHDAGIIDLDITLEEPKKAKEFLLSILAGYNDEAQVGRATNFIAGLALERLVLASGGVPRDFLSLAAVSIQHARLRSNARYVGVQDVNEAAGQISKLKSQEIEDDAASSIGQAQLRLNALNLLRNFLLEEKQTTFLRIDFADKERHTREYDLLQSLMDLRLLHLIKGSLSDEHHAGRRYEVYMLDLSQFSGTRLKYGLKAIDFEKNSLVLKSTGSTTAPRIGDSPKKLLGILRRGPIFELSTLTPLLGERRRKRTL
ncbi:MAG TPA: ATP-binding protein [Stellaceae bacterium]|nr:ATP-binding protein [Stellaceae bacterium]